MKFYENKKKINLQKEFVVFNESSKILSKRSRIGSLQKINSKIIFKSNSALLNSSNKDNNISYFYNKNPKYNYNVYIIA